jgi:hypothetical protein
VDVCGEASIDFVCAHRDAFEFLALAEEVPDQMPPFVELDVDRQRRDASWMPVR